MDVHRSVNSTDSPGITPGAFGSLPYGKFPAHYSNIHGAIYGFAGVSLTITTISTCLRLYTKFHYLKVRRWDDYLMIASWCGLVCMWAFILISTRYGAGDHVYDVPIADGPEAQKYGVLHKLFYAIIQCMLKTSIAMQVMHMFVPSVHFRSNHTRKFWIIAGFTCLQDLWFFIFFWVSLFQCDPVKKEFNYTIPGHCIRGWNQYNIAISVWNMTSDILMLVFPMVCLWKVQMKLRFKLEAASVFLLGSLAVASSLLRLIFTIRRLYTNDLTLVLAQIALCDTGEITAGILAGNSVPLPRLISEITHKIKVYFHPELDSRRGTTSTVTTMTRSSSVTPLGLDHARTMSSAATSRRAPSTPTSIPTDRYMGRGIDCGNSRYIERNRSLDSDSTFSFERFIAEGRL